MRKTPFFQKDVSMCPKRQREPSLRRGRVLSCRPWQSFIILLAFLVNTFGPMPMAQAQEFRLPAPGAMVHLSPPLEPPILKGIKVHPDNPFRFDFILDQ